MPTAFRKPTPSAVSGITWERHTVNEGSGQAVDSEHARRVSSRTLTIRRGINSLLEEGFQLRGHFAVVDVSVEKATRDELRAPWVGKQRGRGSGGREAGKKRLVASKQGGNATEGH